MDTSRNIAQPCSRFSDTPETDMETHREMGTYMTAESWEKAWRAMAIHARKLERERDEWQAVAALQTSRANDLREALAAVITAARQSLPRKHPTVEITAAKFFPAND